MSLYRWPCLILIAIPLAFTSPAFAQDNSRATLSQTLKCSRDLGSGVNILSSAKYDGAKLVGVDLLFNKGLDSKFSVAPERVRFYIQKVEWKLTPSLIEVQRQSQQTLVQYAFPPTRVPNVAVVFLEGAVKSDKNDIGIEANFGIPAPVGSDTEVTNALPSCQNGLVNWKPKDFLASRLMSKDRGVGLEAAIEAIGNVDVADPGNLLMASYWVNSAENPRLAMEIFYKAMYRLRFGTASGNNMALPYFLASTGPDVTNYSLGHTQQLLQALQDTVEWDERTFLQWVDAMGIDPKDVKLQKNREAAKGLTKELIGNLKKDPKKFSKDLEKYSFP